MKNTYILSAVNKSGVSVEIHGESKEEVINKFDAANKRNGFKILVFDYLGNEPIFELKEDKENANNANPGHWSQNLENTFNLLSESTNYMEIICRVLEKEDGVLGELRKNAENAQKRIAYAIGSLNNERRGV